MIYMFLTLISNFMSIKYYLLFNPKTYFLYIILNYKNLKFKHLIDDLIIDLSLLRMKMESRPPHHPNCHLYYYLKGFFCLDSSFFMPKMPSSYPLTSFQLMGIDM